MSATGFSFRQNLLERLRSGLLKQFVTSEFVESDLSN